VVRRKIDKERVRRNMARKTKKKDNELKKGGKRKKTKKKYRKN